MFDLPEVFVAFYMDFHGQIYADDETKSSIEDIATDIALPRIRGRINLDEPAIHFSPLVVAVKGTTGRDVTAEAKVLAGEIVSLAAEMEDYRLRYDTHDGIASNRDRLEEELYERELERRLPQFDKDEYYKNKYGN